MGRGRMQAIGEPIWQ